MTKMENQKYIFPIIKKEGLTPELYLRKLIREMSFHNEILISAQMGMEIMTKSIISDILGIGGWSKEYEEKKQIELSSKDKKKKKYKLIVYECLLVRDSYNKLKI